MGTALNVLIFFIAVLIAGLVTLLLAMGIGRLLKLFWRAPNQIRNQVGLIILAAIELSVSVSILVWLMTQLSAGEIGEMMVPGIIVPTIFRVIIYYSAWKFFDEGQEGKKSEPNSVNSH